MGILLKLFAVDILRVSGTSMETTIRDGDIVFENRLSYGLAKPDNSGFIFQWAQPERGDIVIYLHDNKIVIKRCAAVSGDHLDFLHDSEYSLIAGDRKVSLTADQYNRLKSADKVPDGYILALGDNSADSIDSRMYGFVSTASIIGRVIGK